MRFKFKPDFSKKYENFSEFFELTRNKSKPNKTFEFLNLFNSKTKPYKRASALLFSSAVMLLVIVLGFGLIIIPGSKLSIQKTLKSYMTSFGTEFVDSIADFTHSEGLKTYLTRLMLNAFLFLERNDLFDAGFAKVQLDKLTLAVLDYADQNKEILLSSLNYLSIFIPKVLQKDPELFLDSQVQNSLLNLIDILVEKSSFAHASELLNNPAKMMDSNLYAYELGNYQAVVNGLLVLLRYSKSDETKVLCYNLFNKLISKQNAELAELEEYFCTIDGIQILLSDISSSNQEIQSASLLTTCLLFKNDNQAVKLLKTRVLSNLIKRLTSPEYQTYLVNILNSVKNNKLKNILLTQSELFKIEKERLNSLAQDQTVNNEIRELLKSFLSTS